MKNILVFDSLKVNALSIGILYIHYMCVNVIMFTRLPLVRMILNALSLSVNTSLADGIRSIYSLGLCYYYCVLKQLELRQ